MANFGDGNPTGFLPEAGKTYYIWEVDREYLMPKSLSCWEHIDATNVDVTGFYLVTPIDRTYYSEVGFKVGGEKLKANQMGAGIEKRHSGRTAKRQLLSKMVSNPLFTIKS